MNFYNALTWRRFEANSRKSVVEKTDRVARKEQTLVCLTKNIFSKSAEDPASGRLIRRSCAFLARLEE